jgi:TIR domain/SIR2-like domain
MDIDAPVGVWDDDNWEILLAAIAKERVIPIVGRALSIVEVDGRSVTVDRYVAERLADKLALRQDLPAEPTLNDVVSGHVRRLGRRDEVLYAKIDGILREAAFAVPKPLLQLAEIAHFKLFVTTAFDPLLKRALDQVRFGGADRVSTIGYVPNELPECDIKVSRRRREEPVVYHLLGKSSLFPEYVISDEDLLEYVCALQSDRCPVNLFDELKSSYLLILGENNFSDWLTRLFLRIVKRRRLSDPREPSHAIEVLADDTMHADASLVRFLQNFSPPTKVFSAKAPLTPSAQDFVSELWRRWKDRSAGEPISPAQADVADSAAAPRDSMPAGAIFISYASEDLEPVKKLRAGLVARGLTVWFDKDRLEGGDTYDDKIRRNINRCGLFIAVLSRHADSRVRDAYFRREWGWALERDTRHADSVRFIVPIIIDGTSERDFNNLPARFHDLHMMKLRDGDVTPEFAELLRSSLSGGP